ncbi:MAG: hypothetical protein NWQ25_00840, partial [Prochlorococcaceae cyanobacterium MAG_34]|nr:hypothetical protein [Prochlorococcaceae cyanobacterium MAG_34]
MRVIAIKARITARRSDTVASKFQRRCFLTSFRRRLNPTLRAKRRLALLLLPLLTPVLLRSAAAVKQPAKAPPELVIGPSAPFSGASAQTAKSYQEGLLAW